jgi:predicted 3-demethylubiquinone-9 3-methyltransferase (glyoxalase superfamily)
MSKISPHLWYTDKADEAARFYASIFPDSRVDSVTPIAADTPSGKAGTVKVVEFTLCGQSFLAIGAGPHDQFNDAISLHVTCEDQAEIDRYWNALLAGGGKAVACGWLNDRYGGWARPSTCCVAHPDPTRTWAGWSTRSPRRSSRQGWRTRRCTRWRSVGTYGARWTHCAPTTC